MINTFPLITMADIKNNSNIDTNIDPQWVKNGTLNIQNIQLPDYICQDLIDELCLQSSTNTLTPDNVNLLVYLKPALVNATLYDIFPLFHSRVSNTGVQQQSGENGSSVDNTHMKYLRNEYNTRAISYINKALKFLNDNASLYPLHQCSCDCEKPKINKYGLGIIKIKNKNKIK